MGIIKWLKSGNLAWYDPKTDTIQNCEPGTKAYTHESRHQQQFHNPKIKVINIITEYAALLGQAMLMGSIIWMIAGMPYKWLVIIAAVFTLPNFLFIQYIEIDANLYTWKKHRK